MQKIRNTSKFITFYLRILLYMLCIVALYALTLAPLGALFVFDKGSPLRYLALLTPVLFLFIMLPLRFSFAQAMVQDAPREYKFSFDKAFSLRNYSKKFDESILHLLNVVKWGVPFFALVGVGGYAALGMSWSELMNIILKMGNFLVTVGHAIANFFIRLFGSSHLLVNTGNNRMAGLSVVIIIIAIPILIWLYGVVRNSATRYIWVIADKEQRGVRAEVRSRLKGRRTAQLGTALMNTVLLMPFVLFIAFSIRGLISDFSTRSMYKEDVAAFKGLIKPILWAFFLLYLPLLPARRFLTASFAVRGYSRAKKNEDRQALVQEGAQDEQSADIP